MTINYRVWLLTNGAIQSKTYVDVWAIKWPIELIMKGFWLDKNSQPTLAGPDDAEGSTWIPSTRIHEVQLWKVVGGESYQSIDQE